MSDCVTEREAEPPRAIPDLVRARPKSDAQRLHDNAEWIKSAPIKDLIRCIETTEDPVIHWIAHLALDKVGIPPCLRGRVGGRDETSQLQYQTWLADLLWLTRKAPDHVPMMKRWRGLFKNQLAESWHAEAVRFYLAAHQPGLYHSRGLALSKDMLQPLMLLKSDEMRSDRAILKQMPKWRERMTACGDDRPADKSGQHSTGDLVNHRVKLLSVYLLAGRNRSRAAEWVTLLTGKPISRQALTRHIEAVQTATRMRKLL